MSFYTPPNPPPGAGTPQQQPFVGELHFERPTYTLKALVYSLYILALLILAKCAEMAMSAGALFVGGALMSGFSIKGSAGFDMTAAGVYTGMAVFALGIALIPVLVGKGIGHGSHDMWLLLLVLAILAFVQSVPSLMHLDLIWAFTEGFSKVEALFTLAMPVVVLALAFTPAVREHCRK